MDKQYAAIISSAVVGLVALVIVFAFQGDKSDTCPFKIGEIVSHKLNDSRHLVIDVFQNWGDCWVKTRNSSGYTNRFDAREFKTYVAPKPLFGGL